MFIRLQHFFSLLEGGGVIAVLTDDVLPKLIPMRDPEFRSTDFAYLNH